MPAAPLADGHWMRIGCPGTAGAGRPRALSPEETSARLQPAPIIFLVCLGGPQGTRGRASLPSASEKAQVSASAYDLRSDGLATRPMRAISGQKLDVQLAASPSTAIRGTVIATEADRTLRSACSPMPGIQTDIVTRRDSGRLSLRYGPFRRRRVVAGVRLSVMGTSASEPRVPEVFRFRHSHTPYTRNDRNDVDFHDLFAI